MSLTPELVALAFRKEENRGFPEGWVPLTEAQQDAIAHRLLAEAGSDPIWIFAYGSLIWKPEFETVESRRATAVGWHRSFCMELTSWRGTPEAPGLMMALDRGGQCRGMLYRLPEDSLTAELDRLVRREVSMVPSAFPWRWVEAISTEGPMKALTFAMNRRSGRYIAHLSEDELAEVLATAVGHRGTMAEYLFSTVQKLEELGIHDRNLWRLQALVADRIDAAHPGDD